MNHLPQFIAHHWVLVALFVVALGVLFVEEIRSKGVSGGRLSPQLVTQFINREHAVVIDIREPALFAEGHIVNAINIPPSEFDREKKRLEKYRDRALIIVCATGQRSQSFLSKLQKLQFTKVYLLMGGMNAWKNASMPVVKT